MVHFFKIYAKINDEDRKELLVKLIKEILAMYSKLAQQS